MGMFFPQAEAIECGDILARGHHKLTKDVTCIGPGVPALTLEGGANLDLNGCTVDCDETGREGIVLEGRNARVRNGIINGCRNGVVITGDGHHKVLQLIVENNTREGIRVRSAYNQVINTEARNNRRRGFKIDGDDNSLVNCLAEDNGRHGILIDGGNDNKVRNSAAFRSCRDGIEIDNEGNDNSLINNYVADNGNPVTCDAFDEEYRPWFYAGIDITDGAEENTVINNRTSGNLGCDREDCCDGEDCGDVIERNLLDENVDGDGNCDSTNRWNNNRVDGERAEPECVAAF
jgi:parallel beta-helix repeat protein